MREIKNLEHSVMSLWTTLSLFKQKTVKKDLVQKDFHFLCENLIENEEILDDILKNYHKIKLNDKLSEIPPETISQISLGIDLLNDIRLYVQKESKKLILDIKKIKNRIQSMKNY